MIFLSMQNVDFTLEEHLGVLVFHDWLKFLTFIAMAEILELRKGLIIKLHLELREGGLEGINCIAQNAALFVDLKLKIFSMHKSI